MPRIRPLSDLLISQIAAGEVVERPASVVKELVENALDAGATEISVELAAGGTERIAVTDDGSGMTAQDARTAFSRHATSKIREMRDLEQVGTLGFRGEALSSIAAVARVELVTAERPGEGHRVRVEGGKPSLEEPAAFAQGTSVVVESLFYNVPARRKFLKTPRTELRRCLEVVQGYALGRSEVRFRVVHEGKAVLDVLPAGVGTEGARQRIGQVFGSALAEHLVEMPPTGRDVSVWGFVGDPRTTSGRRYFIFVNRRLLRDRAILGAFYQQVRHKWRRDEFPALFLFLDLPAEEVDVNVHPQKAEVRFRDSRVVGRVASAIGRALQLALGEVEAPIGAPGGGPSAPLAWQGSTGGGAGAAPSWDRIEDVREGLGEHAGRLAEAVYAPLERRPVPLSGRSGEPRSFRLLGQYKGTLILLEGPDGLYIIDQHVAHERLLYERLRLELDREEPASQGLLEPLLLELGPQERARLEELTPALETCGFALGGLSGGSFGVSSVPAALSGREAERVLMELADGGGRDANPEPFELRRRLLDALAAGLACRAAVKMHDPLSADKMEALVAELFAAEQPYVCPHGRPTVLKMSDFDLEKRFGRR